MSFYNKGETKMILGQLIDGKKAKKLIEKGAVLVDVRNPVAFRDGSLPGAINLSLRQLSTLLKYPKTTTIIVFGDQNDEDNTLKSSITYINLYGFQNVVSLGVKDNWET